MTYIELKECMAEYHCERLTRRELMFAIALWQYSGNRENDRA